VWGTSAFRIARVAEHSFLAAPITVGSTVVDLGVSLGEFATAMVKDFGCSVIGIEPVAQLIEEIPKIDRLTVEQFAVAAENKPVTLYLSSSALTATIDAELADAGAPAVEVDGITLAEALDRHDLRRAALVKVDIEGAEIQMLESASLETLQRVDQFSVEFHEFLNRHQRDEVTRIKHRLRSAGFAEIDFSTCNMDVLFVNQSRIPFTAAHRALAVMMYKYPRGLARRFERRTQEWRRARPPG
jgi:FkbM family methyltransferase